MWLQPSLHLLCLYLDTARTYHVILASQNTEALFRQLHDIVGHQRTIVHGRRINHQAALIRLRQTDALERCVPVAGLSTVQSSQCDMRQRLRHPIRAPYVVGETNQCLGQRLIHSTATDNQVSHGHQPLPFLGHLQRVIDLHRHHRRKIYRFRHRTHRMTTGLHREEPHSANQGPHHHHLTGNIVERHTQQGRVALFQSQKPTRDTSRSLHTPFLHIHRLRLTR